LTIFDFEDYRKFAIASIKSMPKKGYGQYRKLATHLGIHTTLVSQIFKGGKSLNLEQAFGVCDFFGLTDLEIEYFLLLVQIERSGHQKLRSHFLKQLKDLKKKSSNLVNRLSNESILSEQDKALFYSEWYYSAIRQLTAINGYQNNEAIAQYFGLPRKLVKEVMEFLISTKLCKEIQGKLAPGPQSTHVADDSPWVKSHHQNWRLRAIERMKEGQPQQLHYSSPMTLSKNDVDKLRTMIVNFIEEVGKVVDPSHSEDLYCLNIDWFRVKSSQG
jgi:uncharacterized protein (TIGR02147 family)